MSDVQISWVLDRAFGKPVFTDINNNTRNNVIKNVILRCVGTNGILKESVTVSVNLSIIDLSSFVDSNSLSKEVVLQWGMDAMDSSVKLSTENKVVELITKSSAGPLIEIKL